ncbi:Glycerophosphodiester phosphodiesterase gde1 [Dictyocoela roeselum]|nr:Glycerophosphodiester phosphodiesterase gde1 [Dictyocoela roeselum]
MQIRLIGHRGFGQTKKSQIPENTLISFKKLESHNIEWTEIDIQITSDGIPIIFHDFTIDSQYIGNYTFGELNRKVLESCGEPLCTLEGLLKETKLKINAELKYPTDVEITMYKLENVRTADEYLAPILDILKRYDREVIFSCFTPEIIEKLCPKNGNLDKKYRAMFLFCKNDHGDMRTISLDRALRFSLEHNIAGLVLDAEIATFENVSMLRSHNLNVYLYGDNIESLDNVKKFVGYGVTGFIVDEVEKALSSIRMIECRLN